VLYADLDNFSRQEKPTITTSQHPLPPIQKATPYVKTDYAEIMHFIMAGANELLVAPTANTCKRWEQNREARIQVG